MKKLLILALLFCSLVSFGHEKSPLKTINLRGSLYLYGNQTIKTMQSTEEIWKVIPDYNGRYEISNKGYVRSFFKGYWKILKAETDKDGYKIQNLSKHGKIKKHKIHRLVAIAFIPNHENKSQVNHIDMDKSNNNDWNLEWSTNQENQKHAHINSPNRVYTIRELAKTQVRSLNPRATPIHQYSLDGKYIASYDCILDAVDVVGVRGISEAAIGRQKTSAGFKWSFIKSETL